MESLHYLHLHSEARLEVEIMVIQSKFKSINT